MSEYIEPKRETIKCIKCEKSMHTIRSVPHDAKWDQIMWMDGAVERIAAGYGSIWDGDMYYIGICDECIEKHQDKLPYVDNYMGLEGGDLRNK